jgi:hypothetical protein
MRSLIINYPEWISSYIRAAAARPACLYLGHAPHAFLTLLFDHQPLRLLSNGSASLDCCVVEGILECKQESCSDDTLSDLGTDT